MTTRDIRRMVLAFAYCLNSASAHGLPRPPKLEFSGEPSTDYADGPFGGCDERVHAWNGQMYWGYYSWSRGLRNPPRNDRYGWTGRYQYAGPDNTKLTYQWCQTLGCYWILGTGEKRKE